jgi:fimbrial chaperone protein
VVRPWARRGWLLGFAWWLPTHLPAYTVEPNLLLLGAGGQESSAFLRLANPERRPAAIEIVVNEFRRDLDGRGVLGKEADERFIVYPAQVILMPGEEVSVQVRWIGTLDSPAEQAFALTTREVAIPRTGQETHTETGVRISINVLMNYDVRIYVAPRGARAKLTVETATLRPQADRQPDLLEVTLANRGTAHHSLRELSLVLTALDGNGNPLPQPPLMLPAESIPGMSAALLANSQRRLVIPWPRLLPVGPVRAALAK